ncbi:MAG: GTP-binding protein, partial [Candidatus Methanoplasma sp.]|nr:GTP-binding protein [Candidatus Methanoplasma sp.]
MGRKEDNIKRATELMMEPANIRNIGTAAHIDHGKTTFSDNLIAGAGMMSAELAGEQRVLDFDEQEAARGITINAASASMVHKFGGKEYLINLIDTPGHVDFGGDVTRAMRALDGVFILCCAVEGIMPQTETVIRQALKERVRPLLFINKVDRMIVEQQVTKEMMIDKFSKLVAEFNQKIKDILPAPLNKQWQVSIQDGTVAFGSAYNNWAISSTFMQRSKISFSDIFDYCAREGGQKELAKKSPLHEVVLEMAIRHIQNPRDAQKIRIPVIWKGDLDTPIGKQMLACDHENDVSMMINKIIMDPHAGEVAIGRLFAGSVKKGDVLYIAGMPNAQRVQTVALMVGA